MKYLIIGVIFLTLSSSVVAQVGTNGEDRKEEGRNIKEYNLTIEEDEITLAGVTAKAMTINGSIPGPVLEFNEGDLAIINVTNKMDEETSVHWHGLILPNFYDGVPYLTTPPIKPGTTFQYRIPINQSGTYWYHSHTMLQEQKGVYGSIIIHPKEKTLKYDKDLVVVLSDWTNEKPMNVLRNLKRGNEWYQVKKGTAVPLSRVISEGALGAQLKFWRDRMEGADIADIYYPAFLTNGKSLAEYPEFKPGEKVRLRFINASASTYYWLDFGGGNPMVVAGDGIDVEPVAKSRFLFGIAETYNGQCNLRFDDTNPAKEDTEYVDSIKEDVQWLGFQWDGIYFASDYFQQLYDFAVQLIKDGKAYICSLSPEETREYRGGWDGAGPGFGQAIHHPSGSLRSHEPVADHSLLFESFSAAFLSFELG